jgi:cell wall assembly regulator SMI1
MVAYRALARNERQVAAKATREGARPDHIQKLEAAIGAALPQALKESLAIHDG